MNTPTASVVRPQRRTARANIEKYTNVVAASNHGRLAGERVQDGHDGDEHERPEPLIPQQQPKQENQKEREEGRSRRIDRLHQQLARRGTQAHQELRRRLRRHVIDEIGSRGRASAIVTPRDTPNSTSRPTIGSRTRPPRSVVHDTRVVASSGARTVEREVQRPEQDAVEHGRDDGDQQVADEPD